MRQRHWVAVGGLALTSIIAAGLLLWGLGAERPTRAQRPEDAASVPTTTSAAPVASGFPRPTIFRGALEDLPQRRAPNEEAIALAGPYDLVIAKSLDEEVLERDRVAPYLRAIKAASPDKIVIDHFLLVGRNPGSQYPPVWPGHWLMLEATGIARDVRAEETDRVLTVVDGSALRAAEDAQLVALDASGRADYAQVEEVRVVAVDGTRVTVARGQRGTKPLPFTAGRARIATHASVTYNETTGAIWKTNFCRESPRDPQGRRYLESLADALAGYLKPGGPLEGLDGYQFDVAAFSTSGQNQGRRRLDCDADGKPDGGYINSVSSYGLGVVEFQRRLRSLVGDRTFLISEATGWWSSRDLAYANGMENESFPDLHHWEQFSSAYQRYQYWREQARAPRLSYLQLKETIEAFTRCPADDRGTNWKLRLSLGAALLGDGYFAYLSANEEGRPQCNWVDPVTRVRLPAPEEFLGGALNRRHYLGMPTGDAKRLNLRDATSRLLARDFEADAGGAALMAARGAEGTVARDTAAPGEGAAALRIDAHKLLPEPEAEHLRVALGPFRVDRGREVTTRLMVRAEPGYARIDPMFDRVPRRVVIALSVRGKTVEQDVMADATWRRYEVAFVPPEDDPAATITLLVGNEPGSVWVDALSVERGPADTFIRSFEHGVVLVNGSSEPATFDLDALAPQRHLRRLEGKQDASVNNGQPARGRVTVPARDALILID